MRSPLTGLRFARLEVQNFRAGTMIKIALAAIALIPLIYAGLFLLAFLDPYGSLVNVPAAVVNEDKGAVINGEERNIGQELGDELIKRNEERSEGEASGYNWKFVDAETAKKGLDDGTYYMELIIPENFSSDIASADSKNPESAQLQAYFNPSTNLIAQTVGSSMVTKIRAALNEKIDKEYFNNIFIKIQDAGDQMQDAVDGSQELQDGIDKLHDGSSALTDGINNAVAGAEKIRSGAQSAQSGSDEITKNLQKLESGAQSADSGADTLYNNMDSLIDGLKGAQSGISLMVDGNGTATNPGIAGIAAQLGAATGGSSTLTQQITTLGTDAGSAAYGVGVAAQGLQSIAQSSTDSASRATAAQSLQALSSPSGQGNPTNVAPLTAANKISDDIKAIQQTSAALQTQMGQLDAAVNGLKTYAANLDAIANGGTITDASGATTQTGGISSAVKGSEELKAGVAQLQSGLSQLSSGSSQLRQGSETLTSGLGALSDGSNTLVVGLGSAASGSEQVTDGLATASDGTSELTDGLKDGQQQLYDNVENSEQKADMMSDPVTANGDKETGENITTVKNYGTGFAPYFIALGMWVGGLMISMILRSLNNRILMSGASSIAAVLASYIPMVIVSMVQVVILLLFIQFGLHMGITYVLPFYLFGLLVSICFVAIIQFFRATMGTTGMVVIVVLLMLQLCTAAGTFPIEAELPVFNVLNPWLPMTYVVHGFRMCMAGLSIDYIWPDVAALLVFAIVFFGFTVLWARHRRRVVMTQLYPPIRLTD